MGMSEEQFHICTAQAENALCKVILKHPETIRLKGLMHEIANTNAVLIDYSRPFEEIYERLLFAAKVLYRERQAKGECWNCGGDNE